MRPWSRTIGSGDVRDALPTGPSGACRPFRFPPQALRLHGMTSGLAGAVVPALDGASVAGLVPALLGARDASWLPAAVRDADQVVLLVLDGLGWHAVEEHRAHMPTLAAMEGGPITTVLPATTATALTSIATGLAPAQHG